MVSTINEMKWSSFKRSLFFRSYLDSSGVVFNTLYMVLFSGQVATGSTKFCISWSVPLLLEQFSTVRVVAASLPEKRMPDGFLVPPVLEYEPC